MTALTGLQPGEQAPEPVPEDAIEQAPLPEGAEAWAASLAGSALISSRALAGGAGQRRYWRLQFDDGGSRVLMWARNERREILPPALREQQSLEAFLEISELLEGAGIPVPGRAGVDHERAWVLLEDLGERHLLDLRGDSLSSSQGEAIDLLARVHGIEARGLPASRSFDRDWIRFELRLFAKRLESPSPDLGTALDELAGAIEVLPRVLCLRDFQSQNLLLDPAGRLRVIDYQDALLAPAELDLAAFLFDSYLEIDEATRTRLLDRYTHASGREVSRDSLALVVLQRKCKDASRFARLLEQAEHPFYAAALRSACTAARNALGQLADGHPSLKRTLGPALAALQT